MHNSKISIKFIILSLLLFIAPFSYAQEVSTADDGTTPTILYSGTPKKYTIAGIKVEGVSNYEDYALISLSGLSVGQKIDIPGSQITEAINRYWKHGLFSNVKIFAEKIEGDKVYLKIVLAQRPRISEINYYGIKKSEKKDLEAKLGLVAGSQITPHAINRAEMLIKRYFDDKGFKNAKILITQKDDPEFKDKIIVNIRVDKKEKIKVHKIYITGNDNLKASKIKKVMKKTNEKGKLKNLFKTKKFIPENYTKDKQAILDKYNELGYRDARIISDSITQFDDKSVDVHINVSEGKKYYLRNISWVGNTLYPSEQLEHIFQMGKGDVYNQKLLMDRLMNDDDAVGNLYYNNGYIFYNLDPVEVNIIGDSIDLEMRIHEGRPATINKVGILGNDRVYENVVRRELRTRPGELFRKDDIMRSMREIQQMGHFDPESITPDIQPDPESQTVNIDYKLVSKSNDQIELSAGWGQTGIIAKVGIKFTNFSFKNLFHPGKNHRGFLPQGDGQTLSLSGQTNAKYYQSYSLSFFDPWFGGKRPNSFSFSMFYSVQTDVSSSFNPVSYYDNMYNYNNYYGGYNYNNYENYYDPDKSMKVFGLSIGWGKRLTWPDDYFTFTSSLSYQRYIMKDWRYFIVQNGHSNNLSFNLTLARASYDNPIFPRQGSDFSLSTQFTLPYSLFDGIKYKELDDKNQADQEKKNKWIEYHKWKFNAKTYLSLMDYTKTKRPLVLMTRFEVGILGHYNSHKRSPFETFEMGGDGMSGYSGYATEMIPLRGYENNSLTQTGYAYAYTRMGLELRYPLMLEPTTSIYVLGFVEGGNAWDKVSKFNPFELKRSAGIGVRIFLPMIGMMGIDWGYGFDKINGSTRYGGSQFHFVLGQEF